MKIEIEGLKVTAFGGILGDATVIVGDLTIQQEDLNTFISTMIQVGVTASNAFTKDTTRVRFTNLVIIPADSSEDIEIMCMASQPDDLCE